MIVYRVEITLQPEIEFGWLDWMKQVHIPDVLRTGCFSGCHIYKVYEPARPDPTYVMQYECRSHEDYGRYRATFAAALQKEHSDRFAGCFHASRQLLEEL